MNRRAFFKRFAQSAAVLALTPQVLAASPVPEVLPFNMKALATPPPLDFDLVAQIFFGIKRLRNSPTIDIYTDPETAAALSLPVERIVRHYRPNTLGIYEQLRASKRVCYSKEYLDTMAGHLENLT